MITPVQNMKTVAENVKKNYMQRYLYLAAVSEACGDAHNLLLDNFVHYADPEMRVTMLSRLNLARADYLRQAEELAHLAQSTEID